MKDWNGSGIAREDLGQHYTIQQEWLLKTEDILQRKKESGPNGISVEVVAHACPQLVRNLCNLCLSERLFHKREKAQRLVLEG